LKNPPTTSKHTRERAKRNADGASNEAQTVEQALRNATRQSHAEPSAIKARKRRTRAGRSAISERAECRLLKEIMLVAEREGHASVQADVAKGVPINKLDPGLRGARWRNAVEAGDAFFEALRGNVCRGEIEFRLEFLAASLGLSDEDARKALDEIFPGWSTPDWRPKGGHLELPRLWTATVEGVSDRTIRDHSGDVNHADRERAWRRYAQRLARMPHWREGLIARLILEGGGVAREMEKVRALVDEGRAQDAVHRAKDVWICIARRRQQVEALLQRLDEL
jgi:hypothetical protein